MTVCIYCLLFYWPQAFLRMQQTSHQPKFRLLKGEDKVEIGKVIISGKPYNWSKRLRSSY